MYSPIPRRSGRDSMRVRFTPANANTARHETSQPGEPEPTPQKISAVFAAPSVGRRRRVVGAREPGEARRVARVVLEVLGEHHRAVAAGGESRPDRRARALGLAGDLAHRVGGRRRGHRRPRSAGARPASACTARAPAGARAPSLCPPAPARGRRRGSTRPAGRPRRPSTTSGASSARRRAPGPRRPRARSRPAPAPARPAPPARPARPRAASPAARPRHPARPPRLVAHGPRGPR